MPATVPGGLEGYSIPRVRLSGHKTGLDALATELKGFKIAEAKTSVEGRRTLTGTSPQPNGAPRVVMFELDGAFSAMALSYELSETELLAWTNSVIPATEAKWLRCDGEG